MFREIKKKKLILENRKPYTHEVGGLIQEMNIIDWTYSSVRLDGIPITKEHTERIVRGEFVTGCTISEHLAIRNHCDAIRVAYEMADMNIELDTGSLFKLYKALTQAPQLTYRRSNPVLRSFDYIPPHFNEIEDQMELLFQWMKIPDGDNDPIRKAACLHHKLIEIYPFEHSESMARMAMQYELIRNGFPPVLLLMSEQEYNLAVIHYLKTENAVALYEALLRGVFNKLEVFMQLTA